MAKVKTVMGWKVVFGGLALALVVAAGLMFAPANQAAAAPQQQCPGDEKIEGNSAFFTAPDGKSIESICIKAGTQLITLQCGETSDCYDVEWIYDGCHFAIAVEVSGGGTSRLCKEISNVVATYIVCE